MKTACCNHVTFVTTLFNTTEVRDYFINDCCLGDDCAAWLIGKLKVQDDLQVDAEPVQEDWGWCFGVQIGQRMFLIGVGLDANNEPNGWRVFIDSQLSSLKRLFFGQNDQAEHTAVCAALDQALRREPRISEIHWEKEV